MTRRSSTTLILSLSLVTLAGCGGSSSGDSGGEKLSIAYSSPVEAQPGQQILIKAYEKAAESLGWDAKSYDSQGSPDAQVSNIETMLQSQVDAISTWTLDAGALQGTYAKAAAEDIPVVGVNSDEESIDTTVWWEYFRCDADAPMKRAAAMIADARPGAKVIVMGGPPVPSIEKYVACFTDAAEAAGLQIVNRTDNAKDDSSNALTLASDLLVKYPDVDAFWAYNDASALGISSAVLSAGKSVSDGTSDGVIIHGANADADAIEAVRQGRLTGTWDPDNEATGVAIVKVTKSIVDGSPTSGTDDDVIVKSTFWDKSNIADYVDPSTRGYTLDNLPLVGN